MTLTSSDIRKILDDSENAWFFAKGVTGRVQVIGTEGAYFIVQDGSGNVYRKLAASLERTYRTEEERILGRDFTVEEAEEHRQRLQHAFLEREVAFERSEMISTLETMMHYGNAFVRDMERAKEKIKNEPERVDTTISAVMGSTRNTANTLSLELDNLMRALIGHERASARLN